MGTLTTRVSEKKLRRIVIEEVVKILAEDKTSSADVPSEKKPARRRRSPETLARARAEIAARNQARNAQNSLDLAAAEKARAQQLARGEIKLTDMTRAEQEVWKAAERARWQASGNSIDDLKIPRHEMTPGELAKWKDNLKVKNAARAAELSDAPVKRWRERVKKFPGGHADIYPDAPLYGGGELKPGQNPQQVRRVLPILGKDGVPLTPDQIAQRAKAETAQLARTPRKPGAFRKALKGGGVILAIIGIGYIVKECDAAYAKGGLKAVAKVLASHAPYFTPPGAVIGLMGLIAWMFEGYKHYPAPRHLNAYAAASYYRAKMKQDPNYRDPGGKDFAKAMDPTGYHSKPLGQAYKDSFKADPTGINKIRKFSKDPF